MNQSFHSLILVLVMAGITILIRFLPFLIFRKGTPKPILYLGEVLPYAIMGMLVVYCLKIYHLPVHPTVCRKFCRCWW